MKRLTQSLVGASLMAILVPGWASTLTVTTTDDASVLVDTLLGGSGSGITISGTPTYTGASAASGTFTGGSGAGIGIDSGIILTNGAAVGAEGPNDSDDYSVNDNTVGDSALDGLAGVSTHDASVLQFDFTSTTGELFFHYVFGSEEYNEYVGEFNDPFGFFLNGQNIALIPGSSDPVTVNNVNCGNPYNPPNGGVHCDLFNNNDLDDGGPFFDIQYDGFTDVFTAHATGLGTGVNTIKLAIADALDHDLDSGVFIQGFSSVAPPPVGVPEPSSLLMMGSGLAAFGFFARKRKSNRKA